MKALTVKLPWSWAIYVGAKLVENRSQPTRYRGPLAIHAGAGWSERGAADPRVLAEWRKAAWDKLAMADGALDATSFAIYFRRVLAVADLVDCHEAQPLPRLDGTHGCCCEPWGEARYVESGGRTRTVVFHYVLENVRRIPNPPEYRGRLGLWNVPEEVAAQVTQQLAGVNQ